MSEQAAPIRTVRFAPSTATPFAAALKEAVGAYFRERKLSVKAPPATWVKAAFIWLWAIASYAVILWPGLSWGVRWAACASLGAAFAGVGMAIGHDALHGAYSHKDWLNRLVAWSFDAIGANGYIWRYTHNRIHHTYTNIDGVDLDLDYDPVLRMAPSTPWRPIHRFQFLYAFPLYGTAGLHWLLVKDLKYFLQRSLGPYRDLRHPPRAWAFFLVSRAAVLGYTIAIPILVLRPAWWQFLIGFVTTAYVSGLVLGIVFQLAHAVAGPDILPTTPRLADPFLAHQLKTTANFACDNRLLSMYVGGLNYQIEHHLFPHISSAHYPALRPIVRDVARKHGLPYHEHPSMWSALKSHARHLHRMGRAPERSEAAHVTPSPAAAPARSA